MSKRTILEKILQIGILICSTGLIGSLMYCDQTESIIFKCFACLGAIGFIAMFVATYMMPIPPCDKN